MKILGLPVLLAMAGCASKPPALPVYGQLPNFELTSQTGQQFDRKAIEGQIWVADFIFTSCTGPCPRMSSLMQQVQGATSGLARLKLVSFTVDPERDTPRVLAEYARRYHAVPGRWFFLTGDRKQLHLLARDAFKLSNVDGSMDHSTRFVLVDGQSRIRGYYGTSEDSGITQLVRDIKRLASEKS